MSLAKAPGFQAAVDAAHRSTAKNWAAAAQRPRTASRRCRSSRPGRRAPAISANKAPRRSAVEMRRHLVQQQERRLRRGVRLAAAPGPERSTDQQRLLLAGRALTAAGAVPCAGREATARSLRCGPHCGPPGRASPARGAARRSVSSSSAASAGRAPPARPRRRRRARASARGKGPSLSAERRVAARRPPRAARRRSPRRARPSPPRARRARPDRRVAPASPRSSRAALAHRLSRRPRPARHGRDRVRVTSRSRKRRRRRGPVDEQPVHRRRQPQHATGSPRRSAWRRAGAPSMRASAPVAASIRLGAASGSRPVAEREVAACGLQRRGTAQAMLAWLPGPAPTIDLRQPARRRPRPGRQEARSLRAGWSCPRRWARSAPPAAAPRSSARWR